MNTGSRAFRIIRDFWYKKLKEDGFQDIENADNELLVFNIPRFDDGRVKNKERFDYEKSRKENNENYFSLCRSIMNTPDFEAAVKNWPNHRKIWQMHCDGKSFRQIGETLHIHLECARYAINKIRILCCVRPNIASPINYRRMKKDRQRQVRKSPITTILRKHRP
jgi:hypothetical protein